MDHELPLFEDFVLKDDIFYFDPTTDPVYIDTKPGKSNYNPRVSKSDSNIQILSAYVKSHDKKDQNMVVDILKSLKGKGRYKVDEESYKKFIKRTAIYFYHLIKSEPIDLVITIQSSSPLTKDLVQDLIKMIPYDVDVCDDGVLKNIDVSTIGVKDDSRITPDIKNYLDGVIKNATKDGYFSVQPIRPIFRKFVKDFLLVDEDLKSKIDGKVILLIDDFLTTGITMNEAIRLLTIFNPAKIIALTMIK